MSFVMNTNGMIDTKPYRFMVHVTQDFADANHPWFVVIDNIELTVKSWREMAALIENDIARYQRYQAENL